MKRCQICGQLCADQVDTCPSCQGTSFLAEAEGMVQDNYINDGRADDNTQYGMGAGNPDGQNTGAENAYGQAPDMGSGGPGAYDYGQYHDMSGQQLNNGEKMTKSQFYKNCVPQDLKGQLVGGYAILILNILVLGGIGIWYEEPLQFVDCAVLLVILLGLIFTKGIAFAIVDTVYFSISCIISMVGQQRPAGVLALIIAIGLISVTYKIGRLWSQYKKTGEYVNYSTADPDAGKKRKRNIIAAVITVVILLAAVVAVIFMQDGGFQSFKAGTWEGRRYENESLKLAVEVPEEGWSISDEEELEELNKETKSEAGALMNAEEFDCMVTNEQTGASFMIIHMKGSYTEEQAVQEIRNNLMQMYREQYYSTPIVTNAGKKTLGGSEYTRLDVRITIYGAALYQRVYIKKAGREICEIGFTGLDSESMDEMEAFFSAL